jgi:endoribonuclease Dicer
MMDIDSGDVLIEHAAPIQRAFSPMDLDTLEKQDEVIVSTSAVDGLQGNHLERREKREIDENPRHPFRPRRNSQAEQDDENSDGEDDEHVEEVDNAAQQRSEREAVEQFRQSYVRDIKIRAETTETVNTVKKLVEDSSKPKIITTPREYQIEIYEKAKTQNVIAVLETGTGKTLIAVLLLRHTIEEELERRAAELPPRISFFVVPSVALVFQQYDVLHTNLDQPMAQLCGAMGTDLWSKDMWLDTFKKNMVIVLTAEVLYQCLAHSYVKMSQINLLIFDEAHHAKDRNSYALIMREFYFSEPNKALRPRIFGMTASPVDAKVNVAEASLELEATLDAQILTSSDEAFLPYHVKRCQTKTAIHHRLEEPFETPLCASIKAFVEDIRDCRKMAAFSVYASSELGKWMADEVFRVKFTEEFVSKETLKLEAEFMESGQATSDRLKLDEKVKNLKAALDIVQNHQFKEPYLNMELLSSKLYRLVLLLRQTYEKSSDNRTIVFVERRDAAMLIASLLKRPSIKGSTFLAPDAIVGGGSQGSLAGDVASFKEQLKILKHFRDGSINCLIATSVAEEGLDIPDCNTVVRFDLPKTVIQFIQSRGRARMTNSEFVLLLETSNPEQTGRISELSGSELVLKTFCKALPEDRLITGSEAGSDYSIDDARYSRISIDPETGAKLTYRMALTVLGNFVDSLIMSTATTEGMSQKAEYIIMPHGGDFVCEVILPSSSPVTRALGPKCRSKRLAKAAAAFDICLLLRENGLLDGHFISTLKKRIHKMRNANLALNSGKEKEYAMRTKPAIWSANEIPQQLFLTIMALKDPSKSERKVQPLGLLTRAPLPELPKFELWLSKTNASPVVLRSFSEPLQTDDMTLKLFNMFTLRIFEDVFSKEYDWKIETMPYFLVPMRQEEVTAGRDAMDWDALYTVMLNKSLMWGESFDDSFFEDRFLTDPYDGSRKLWSHRVSHEYKPLDPIPSNQAVRAQRKYHNTNILEYSCSMFKRSRDRRVFSPTQPVLEADIIPLKRNYLDNSSYDGLEQATKCYVVPEPLSISALSTGIVAMAQMFPAIIYRIESYLIALEAATSLELPLSAELALECMTKSGDVENLDVISQRGLGRNYERLEFLGDCFLKMATSISLYVLHPDSDQDWSHNDRMMMICNQNLMKVALDLKLYEYIRSLAFNRRSWYPDGVTLIRGNSKAAKRSHGLADKTIADVSEAMIGAAYLTGVDHAVRAVTKLVSMDYHVYQKWGDYAANYQLPRFQRVKPTAVDQNLADQVFGVDGYQFKYPRLLRSAFIHRSYPRSYTDIPCYERLEFLGDSILDMVCVEHLFSRFPNKGPGWLTEHKMAMVANQFLAAVCVKLDFHRHLLSLSSTIGKNIKDYVEEIAEAQAQSNGAVDYWVSTKTPPKCLADMVEAYIGALFVDNGFSLEQPRRFFTQHILPFFEDMSLYDTYAGKHPINQLNHFLVENMGCTDYKIHVAEMEDVGDGEGKNAFVTVLIHGKPVAGEERESARYAKNEAAKKAVEMLKGITVANFRNAYGCDCEARARAEGAKPRHVREMESSSESASLAGESTEGEAVGGVTPARGPTPVMGLAAARAGR